MNRFWIWFVFFLIPAFVQCSILLWNVDRNDYLELNDIFDSKNGRVQFFLFLLPEVCFYQYIYIAFRKIIFQQFSMAQLSQQFGAYDTEEKCTNLVHFKVLLFYIFTATLPRCSRSFECKGYQLMNSHLGSRILNDPSTALFAQKDALNVDNWKNMNRVILKLTSWEDLAISEKSLQYVFNETAVHSLRLNGANGFAYACRKPRALMIPTSREAKFQYGIAFLKLQVSTIFMLCFELLSMFELDCQVQPFRAARTNGFTDNIDDCTPFFTAEVWMSLISVFVIFAITIFGVSMISSLKTMDRFDDPKGKSLVINFKE
ncbi:vacuolar ATP synthase subunit S1 [Trichinella spiralis]|uniref:vacuolar ATP synthase subunit S1 n=1 Tax=Trichinella spiralis TaxID=6334 RepID=UPI0001EFCB22|nr:vacuolar ATP synthase subunit S1 [Trichinella spiralis]